LTRIVIDPGIGFFSDTLFKYLDIFYEYLEMEMVLDPYSIGLMMIFVGIAIVFIGIIYLMYTSIKEGSGKVEGGGVVVIGPVPIVFGTSEKITKLLIILAIVLFIIVLSIEFIPFYLHSSIWS